MSHFYGTVQGSRGQATRCGGPNTGIETWAASWSGAIRVVLFCDEAGNDCYRVEQQPWRGHGITETLAEGLVGEPAQ